MWSRRRLRSALSLVVVLTLVVSAVAPLAAASPRPSPVCGVCSDRVLSSSAEGHDLSLSVDSSTATVEVQEQAAERWTVRVELSGPGVARLRDDSALATELVEDATFRDASAVSAHVEADTLVAQYRTTDFATRVNGAYRLDGLRDDPGAVVYTDLGADRLTVRGPEGTTAAISPPHATADGRTLTLTEWSGGWVVFASGPVAPLTASLAVLDAVGVLLLTNAIGYLVVPGLVLAAGLAAVLRATERTDTSPERSHETLDSRLLAVAGLGLLVVLHPLLLDVQPVVNDYAPALLAGGVAALVVAGVAAVRDRLTVELATLTATGGFLGGVLAVFSLPLLVGDPIHAPDSFGEALRASLLALPVVCCFPLGVAGSEKRRVGFGVVFVAFALLAVSAFDLTTRATFGVFGYLLAFGGALAIAALGVPFVLLGRRFSTA